VESKKTRNGEKEKGGASGKKVGSQRLGTRRFLIDGGLSVRAEGRSGGGKGGSTDQKEKETEQRGASSKKARGRTEEQQPLKGTRVLAFRRLVNRTGSARTNGTWGKIHV